MKQKLLILWIKMLIRKLFSVLNFWHLTNYFQNLKSGRFFHQKYEIFQILVPNRCYFRPMALDLISGPKCFFTQILEWQVFSKIFRCLSNFPLRIGRSELLKVLLTKKLSFGYLLLFFFRHSDFHFCLAIICKMLNKNMFSQFSPVLQKYVHTCQLFAKSEISTGSVLSMDTKFANTSESPVNSLISSYVFLWTNFWNTEESSRSKDWTMQIMVKKNE